MKALSRSRRACACLAVASIATALAAGCADDDARDAADSDVGAASTDPTVAAVRAAFQHRGEDPRLDATLGSLVFPSGTTYGQALLELTLIQAGVKQTTAARVGPPLPDRAVVALPGRARRDFRLSLAAPEGYDVASGRPLVTPLRAPASSAGGRVPVSAAGPWPAGAALPVPVLPECMVSRGGDPPAVACTPDDVVQIRADAEVPLP